MSTKTESEVHFADLGLCPEIMRAIDDLGFERCTPIQVQGLPHSLAGTDLVGKAQTGTGKTAAFLITMINDFLNNPIEAERYAGEPRALVIAPTRELALQIAADAELLAAHTSLSVVTLIGGVDYDRQLSKLHSSLVDILVATPGRLLDFNSRREIHLDRVEILVIDEADRMLDMGFIPQVRRIVHATPRKEFRQTLFFSATINYDVLVLANSWTKDHVMVEIEPERIAAEAVEQQVYLISRRDKYHAVRNILRRPEVTRAMVFANRRDETRRLYEKLRRDGFNCGLLSGEVAQPKRLKTLEAFKGEKIDVLVATDVAGRGLHVEGVSHVINYSLPDDPEDYVHRIGRTGRAGAAGTSISLATEDDAFLLPALEAMLGHPLNPVVPSSELTSP